MTILKDTISLCPTCLAELPATIEEMDGAAMMVKTCPEHGPFVTMVERDVQLYKLIQANNAKWFYPGLIIDVTYRCNLRCKWCFQHLSNEDVPKERIYQLARQMPHDELIILSGGEPTVRNDLAEIVNELVAMGYRVSVITNGYKIDWTLPCQWTLSHHPESLALFSQRVQEARDGGHTFASIIYTDNSLEDFYAHVQEAIRFDLGPGTVFRMHAAAPVGGNLSDSTAGLFVSDMHNLLIANGHDLAPFPGKTIFLPLFVDCTPFMLISWNTAQNVDILENHCQPWYHGKGNSVDNLVTRIIRDN